MQITYRRAGGGFALLTVAAVLVATVLTVIVGAALLIVGVAIATVFLLARAVLPTSWRRRQEAPATPWPHETIEATVVNPRDSSGERHPLSQGQNVMNR
jgi:hypothetical protein